MGMTDAIDLTPAQRQQVQALLERYLPGTTVWAFGSRVTFKARPDSDLDLVAFTTPEQKSKVSALKEAFEESDLPFRVDLLAWDDIPENFRKNIEGGEVSQVAWASSEQGSRPAPLAPSSSSAPAVRPAGSSAPPLGKLPEGWNREELENLICELIDYRGKTPKKTLSGIPLITAKIVKNGRLEPYEEYIDSSEYDDWMTRGIPKPGSVILTTEAPLGEVASLPMGKIALAQRIIVLNGKIGVLDNDYLRYFLFSSLGQFRLKEKETGTTVTGIKQSQLRRILIDYPTYLEQQKIAAILSALDDKIALNRATNQTLEQIAQALFKSWFVDFDPVHAKARGEQPVGMDVATAALFPATFEESELGMIPKGWEVGSLADIASFQNGYAFKSKDWSDSGCIVIKIGDVKPGIIDTKGSSFVAHETVKGLDRFKLNRGDLIVGMTGYVGETGLVPKTETEMYLNQRVGRFTSLDGTTADSYIYCVVRNPEYKTLAEGKAKGSAQANISGSELLSYPLVMPPKILMAIFNKVISVNIEAILRNYEETKQLETTRDSLLSKLLSGEISVADATDLVVDA